jgi:hypothetical protein
MLTTRDASAKVAPNSTSWAKRLTEALRRQASVLQRPPFMFEQLLELLAATVPNFVEAVR